MFLVNQIDDKNQRQHRKYWMNLPRLSREQLHDDVTENPKNEPVSNGVSERHGDHGYERWYGFSKL